jgi:hypothetical protein
MKVTNPIELLKRLRATGTGEPKLRVMAGIIEEHVKNTGQVMTPVELYQKVKAYAIESTQHGYELTLKKMNVIIVTGEYVPKEETPVLIEDRLAEVILQEQAKPAIEKPTLMNAKPLAEELRLQIAESEKRAELEKAKLVEESAAVKQQNAELLAAVELLAKKVAALEAAAASPAPAPAPAPEKTDPKAVAGGTTDKTSKK